MNLVALLQPAVDRAGNRLPGSFNLVPLRLPKPKPRQATKHTFDQCERAQCHVWSREPVQRPHGAALYCLHCGVDAIEVAERRAGKHRRAS